MKKLILSIALLGSALTVTADNNWNMPGFNNGNNGSNWNMPNMNWGNNNGYNNGTNWNMPNMNWGNGNGYNNGTSWNMPNMNWGNNGNGFNNGSSWNMPTMNWGNNNNGFNNGTSWNMPNMNWGNGSNGYNNGSNWNMPNMNWGNNYNNGYAPNMQYRAPVMPVAPQFNAKQAKTTKPQVTVQIPQSKPAATPKVAVKKATKAQELIPTPNQVKGVILAPENKPKLTEKAKEVMDAAKKSDVKVEAK